MGLDAPDGIPVAVETLALPVVVQLDAVQASGRGALEADQDFRTSRFAHQVQNFGVVGHGHVGLGEPLDAFVGQGPQQFFGTRAVDERVVVGEFDEGARPDLLDRPYLPDHVLHRLQLVPLGHQDRAGAEVAPPRAAALGLHRDPVVFVGVQQVEPGQRRVGKIKLLPAGAVDAAQAAVPEVLQHPRPGQFGLADHHRVAVADCLVRQRGGVMPADDGFDPCLAVPAGQGVGVLDLGGERGDGGQIAVRQPVQLPDVGHLVVLDLKAFRRHPRQGEQRQAGQGGNHLAAFHEARHGHAQRRQFLVVGAHAAHGYQCDLHRSSSFCSTLVLRRCAETIPNQ